MYPHEINGTVAWHGARLMVHHPDNGQFSTAVHHGDVGFGVKLTNGVWYHILAETTAFAWHNLTGVWTKGGHLWLYLNGVLVAARQVPNYYLCDPGFTPEIGSAGGTHSFFDGLMDEVKVYTNVSPPPPPPSSFYNLITSTSTGQGEYGATTSPHPGTYMYRPGTVVNVAAFLDKAGQYSFDHWELNGTDVGSANPYPLTMDANYALHAVFVTPPYDVTINAYCYTEATAVNVGITMDGTPGYNTPHTFTGLTGTHTFTVPSTDPHGHPFKQWSTGSTSTTITVSTGGTYTAYYGEAPQPPPVGGVCVPVDKFGLLAPYIGLVSTIVVATVATAIYAKRRKEKR